jgi:hypothetical protein
MGFEGKGVGRYMNKIIAPVIVTLCLTGYYIMGAIILTKLNLANTIKIIVIIISITMTVVIIMVLAERIKEINGGEDDDLGKY